MNTVSNSNFRCICCDSIVNNENVKQSFEGTPICPVCWVQDMMIPVEKTEAE